jgi:AraC-like DNA-binding protein
MHQFKHDLGVPLRRYLLWRRVQSAMAALADGHSATETAQLAGFHDASHLNRVFKQLLELTPGELARLGPDFNVHVFV